jgi:hypothetical protein
LEGTRPLDGRVGPELNNVRALTWCKLVVIERELYLIWRIGRDLSPAARVLQRGILAGAQAICERSLVG